MKSKVFFVLVILFISLSAIAIGANQKVNSKSQLGERLFHDVRLSKDGKQSCASCHNSARAFSDTRREDRMQQLAGAVSVGQDGFSIGDRNAPMLTYAALTPEFHFNNEEGLFFGGFFHDGRASTLEEQALHPFTDPIEMQMTERELASRIRVLYGKELKVFITEEDLQKDKQLLALVAELIATFERSDAFVSFDSKFDRVLRGEERFSPKEQRGHDLFVAEDKANCAACHPVPDIKSRRDESLFTDFSYDNLGVPTNRKVRSVNGKTKNYRDLGLAGNPKVEDENLKGAFKVPSLRNIAVTAPYMHNGVFNDLRTVVAFYNSRDVNGALNPETGKPWGEAEFDGTKNTEELGDLGLTEQDIDDIVSFMLTFTDQRFEQIMPDK